MLVFNENAAKVEYFLLQHQRVLSSLMAIEIELQTLISRCYQEKETVIAEKVASNGFDNELALRDFFAVCRNAANSGTCPDHINSNRGNSLGDFQEWVRGSELLSRIGAEELRPLGAGFTF